jgi:D-alanyl-D-alanine carboxypeptidase
MRLRTIAPALLLAAGLLVPAGASPPSANAVGPLPACRLDDVLTEPRGYDDWATLLVDWNLTLGSKYRPPDLVSVRDGGVAGGGYVRAVAIDDLQAMADAARENGTPLVAWSPFRSYKQQVRLFNDYAGWTGKRYTNFDDAITFSARPGHSEHQTGLTIDFVAVGDAGLTSNWEVTRTGAWMAENAWKYGWLMSYPKGKDAEACYHYEPWHYRYVGRDMAAAIHESGLTIREYLWANFTQLDSACVAAPQPTLLTPGKPRSCALAATPSGAPSGSGSPGESPISSSGAPGSPGPASAGPSGRPVSGPLPGGPAGPAADILGLDPPIFVGLVVLLLLVVVSALGLRRLRSRPRNVTYRPTRPPSRPPSRPRSR